LTWSQKTTLNCTINDKGIGRDKAGSQKGAFADDDRPNSASITETRIKLFNASDSPPAFKIVYTDLFDDLQPCGLKVEMYIPMENTKA